MTPEEFLGKGSFSVDTPVSPDDFLQGGDFSIDGEAPEKGLLQSIASSVLNPLGRFGATVAKGATGVATALKSGLPAANKAMQEMDTKGFDFPYIGNYKPVGNQGTIGSDLKDMAGVGTEAASFLPVAALPSAAINTFKGPLIKGALQGASLGAASGLLYGAGNEMQKAESTFGDVAKSAGSNLGIGAAFGGALGAVSPAVNKGFTALQENVAKKAANQTPKALAGQIFQAKPSAVAKAIPSIKKIDATKVKTYADLEGQLSEFVKETVDAQDKTLEKYGSFTLNDLVNTTKVGEQDVSHNYVVDALTQLEELYKKTNDVEGLAKLNVLINKSLNEGLTAKEVNKIAREYGSEVAQKAFDKTGQPLTSINAQMFENTRSGVKNTLRNLIKDPEYKQADEQLTALISARDLSKTVAEKVALLKNRVSERSLGAKLGRGITNTIDTLTGGVLKGALQAAFPSNVGLKVNNFIQIEDNLQQTLMRLQEVLDAPENLFINKLNRFLNGPFPVNQTSAKLPTNDTSKSSSILGSVKSASKSVSDALTKPQRGFVNFGEMVPSPVQTKNK